MRASVLHAAEGATIVLTFQHTLADGLSGVHVIHDLMRALAGEPLDAPRDVPKAAEAYAADIWPASEGPREGVMPPGLDADALRAVAASPMWVPFSERDPRVSTLTLDRDATGRLRRRGKAEGRRCTARSRRRWP